MSDAPAPLDNKFSSLWRETFHELKPIVRAEWRWIAGFSLFMAVMQFLTNQDIDPHIVTAHQGTIQDQANTTRDALLGNPILGVFDVPFLYFCCAVAIKSLFKDKKLDISVGHFFYWIWKNTQKYLIMLAFFTFGVFLVEQTAGTDWQVYALGAAVTLMLYSYYVYFRLFLVSPLALSQHKPVLRASWALTKGQFFRLFINYVVVLLCSGLPFMLLFAVFWDQYFVSGQELLKLYLFLLALTHGTMTSLMAMIAGVYSAVCYRTLSNEKSVIAPIATDPT